MGELVLTELFRDFDLDTNIYSNLAVKEERIFVRNIDGWIQYRDMIITWYHEDGITEYIPEVLFFKGSIRRRTEEKNQHHKRCFYDGVEFLNLVNDKVGLFIKGSLQPLISVVQDATEIYMTQAVKDVILSILYKAL